MADQEFLASFGVEIDESGVKRLQAALSENQTLAGFDPGTDGGSGYGLRRMENAAGDPAALTGGKAL